MVGVDYRTGVAIRKLAASRGVSVSAQLRALVDVGISTLAVQGEAEIAGRAVPLVGRVDLDGGGKK